MSVQVKFFASLRDKIGRDSLEVDYSSGMKVVDIWRQVASDQPTSEQVLSAVNLEYAHDDTPVSDGDEVAFFPPVTGG